MIISFTKIIIPSERLKNMCFQAMIDFEAWRLIFYRERIKGSDTYGREIKKGTHKNND